MDKNKIFKQKNIILALGVTIVGLILLFIKEPEFLGDIGSILLISGVYSILDSYFLKQSMTDMIIEKINLDKAVDDTGLVDIGSNLRNINYQKYFEEAKKNIDILHVYARTWTTNNFDFIKDTVMNNECRLRIILLNPDSPFVSALETHYDYQPGELKKYINEVVSQWKKLAYELEIKKRYFTDKKYRKKNRKSYKTNKCGTIELYFNNGQPTNSIYRIDEKIIMVSTKTSKDKSIRAPYFIYCNNKIENNVFSMYVKEIEKVIDEGEKVELVSEAKE
ncbi:MAG: hypothetical protein E7526_03870 [Ruminococcaceae bacterium]|nr:hypothetical protein [Oscillospiraceae bacterium]